MAFFKILKVFLGKIKLRRVKEKKANEIYVFLAFLCKYEIDNDKMHAKFVIFLGVWKKFEISRKIKTFEDWNDFAKNLVFSEIEEVMFLNEWVFRQNLKNFTWTSQEDELLREIIEDFKYFFKKSTFFEFFF